MEPTPELIDALYREEVLEARCMKPEDKLLAGPELFAFAASITKAGIHHQHPDADAEEVERIFAERIALAERLERAR